jgi:acyl-CoA thioester hydrolase
MPKIYRSQVQVRGYELDSFGHVNHAVYVSYCEHARWNLLTEEGITLERFKAWKKWPIIAGIELRYLKPTYLNDLLEIETRVVEFKKSSFTFEQRIHRDGNDVALATVHAVMINEEGRPTGIPDELREIWELRESEANHEPS